MRRRKDRGRGPLAFALLLALILISALALRLCGTPGKAVIAGILVLNLLAYLVFARDKKNAENRLDRISENTLLLVAFFALPGAMCAVLLCDHKIKKLKIQLGFFLIFLLHLLFAGAAYTFFGGK